MATTDQYECSTCRHPSQCISSGSAACALPFMSLLFVSGIIRTALANMDREAREHYTVVIQAKDMAGQVGGLSGSTTINITLTDINDNPPKFPQSE